MRSDEASLQESQQIRAKYLSGKKSRQRIVIIGGGFGVFGLYIELGTTAINLAVIDKRNHDLMGYRL
ncbi:hypothetical protein [Pararhizobium arenae]|uniref:hypothetical protein n=1 Tax=Pararhizobium arenae TaxID=1856850 RepID=UPI00094AC861|nr:hypothetical protein [Pararhizobium arenae]